VKIIKNLSKIDKISCPKTMSFCVTIVERVSLNMLRDEHRGKYVDDNTVLEFIPDSVNIEDEVCLQADKEMMVKKLAELPDIYRSIIYLYYGNGYSQKQIAETLGISYESARKRLQRAKKCCCPR
jgi:RNA polymerase sigma-70 factor (ECF subfamily)